MVGSGGRGVVGSGGRGVVRVEGDKENYNNYKLIGAVLGQHFIITGTTSMRQRRCRFHCHWDSP